MPFAHDPSCTRAHEKHHFGDAPTQPEPLSEQDKHLVEQSEIELEDGSFIATEVFDSADSKTLKIVVCTDQDAKDSHKTAANRVDRAEAHQIDEAEGTDGDYYNEWKNDIGKRQVEKDFTPKHHHTHGLPSAHGHHG